MSFYFRRIPEEYEESNGLEVTVYKDPAGQLSKLVKIEQAAAYVFWFSNNTNVHESTLRVSFRALVGVNYAIQVDSAYDVGGQFHLNWKYGAGQCSWSLPVSTVQFEFSFTFTVQRAVTGH